MILALGHSYAKAVTELQTAIRLSPGLTQAHVDLAGVLDAVGHTDEAVREYEIAIQGNPLNTTRTLRLENSCSPAPHREARLHLEAAAQSTDIETRQAPHVCSSHCRNSCPWHYLSVTATYKT